MVEKSLLNHPLARLPLGAAFGAGFGAATGAAASDPGHRKEGAKRGAKYGAIIAGPSAMVGVPYSDLGGGVLGGVIGRETEGTRKARAALKASKEAKSSEKENSD